MAPGMCKLAVDMFDQLQNLKIVQCKMSFCKKYVVEVKCIDCGNEAAEWISKYLNKPTLRLAYALIEPETPSYFWHQLKQAYRLEPDERNIVIPFNTIPRYTLLSHQSLIELSKVSSYHNDQNHFSPDICFTPLSTIPFIEFEWEWIMVGKAIMRNVKPWDSTIVIYDQENNIIQENELNFELQDIIIRRSQIFNLHFAAPESDNLMISCPPPAWKFISCKMSFCKKYMVEVMCIDCGDVAADWISTYLNKPTLRLAYALTESEPAVYFWHQLKQTYRLEPDERNIVIPFNTIPRYTLLSHQSLTELNKVSAYHIDQNHFSSDIYFTPLSTIPFIEFEWEWIMVGEAIMKNVKPWDSFDDEMYKTQILSNRYQSLSTELADCTKKWVQVGRVRNMCLYPMFAGKAMDLPVCQFDLCGLSAINNNCQIQNHMFIIYNQKTKHKYEETCNPVLSTLEIIPMSNHIMLLKASGMHELILDLMKIQESFQIIPYYESLNHKHLVELRCLDCGKEAAEWVSRCLDKPDLRLGFNKPGSMMRELYWNQFGQLYSLNGKDRESMVA
ncbi:hypothetical protein EAI_03023 [Harpegnathos saltator]|uniref:Uncharacterized protein n=1 Tax=Harpegnathos saltator TaxID=610380 RepID=E2BE08_HARSA|nr:hypothetical protein EAI_03023 [Harpegnathos saltator]